MKLVVEIESDFEIPVFRTITDLTVKKISFERHFKIQIWERDKWVSERPFFKPEYIGFYIDGSKKDDQIGSEVWGTQEKMRVALGNTLNLSEFVCNLVWDCLKNYLNWQIKFRCP